MRHPDLTIALPTYNRAELLGEQMAWLATAVRGHEEQCEVIIADNCSTDETPEILEQWRDAFADELDLKMVRRSENIGAVRNIATCIDEAAAPYVWTISDDDELAHDALEVVLGTLKRHPDLTLLLLNYSSRMASGERLFARCFTVDQETFASPGWELFQRFLAYRKDSRWGGLLLTTAVVYRTAVAREAFRRWPRDRGHQLVQLFVSGYCAANGKMLVTEMPLLEAVGGRAHFAQNPAVHFAFLSADTAEAFVALARIGYSPWLCLRKLIERPAAFLRLLPRAVRSDPVAVLGALRRYVGALVQGAHCTYAAYRRRP